MPFLKPLTRTKVIEEGHEKWKKVLKQAEIIYRSDADIQKKAAKGLYIKERTLVPEIVGRMYADYCILMNKLYDAYICNVQVQKEPYIKEICSIILKRLYELREELVHIIVNDYIYVDAALIQNKITPFDIEIVVPYYFSIDSREDSIEELLRNMWTSARKRKLKALRPPKPKKIKEEDNFQFEVDEIDMQNKPMEGPIASETEVEEEEESIEEIVSVATVTPLSFTHANLIQSHERFRLFYISDFKSKCQTAKKYAEVTPNPPPEIISKVAACLIQRVYREFMRLKRKSLKDKRRDIILGVISNPLLKVDLEETTNRFYNTQRTIRQKMYNIYQKEFERSKARIYCFRKNDHIENITDEIVEWFKYWYRYYGFFPDIPYEIEGGTLLVVRGDYITIEEKIVADEALRKKTQGKSKDQLKEERKQEVLEAKQKILKELLKQKNEAELLFKLRCNPTNDPGYKIKETTTEIGSVLDKYRYTWSLYDELDVKENVQAAYGYMMDIVTEDIMSTMHKDLRKMVDELMRLDLKLLIKAQQEMFKLVGKKFPKLVKKRPPKEKPVPKKIELNEDTQELMNGVFDLEIITKPTTKLKEISGDLKYAVYEYNVKDPDCSFPAPGYGDVKRRLILSCAMGIGIDSGAKKNKAVLLLGPPHNGKSFLVDAIAGQLNAVKIDVSPEMYNSKTKAPGKMLSKVFTTARIFQPSIIFFKNIEKLFYKKIPPEEKHLAPGAIKAPLKKLLKSLPNDEKVIFIATCSDPWVAKPGLGALFNEIIFVPPPNYGSIVQIFGEKFKQVYSIPETFNLQGLGQLLKGYGMATLIELFNNVMTPARIAKLNEIILEEIEFIEPLLHMDLEPTSEEKCQEYMVWRTTNSSLKKEANEYKIICLKRADVYEKLAKKKEKKE